MTHVHVFHFQSITLWRCACGATSGSPPRRHHAPEERVEGDYYASDEQWDEWLETERQKDRALGWRALCGFAGKADRE